jgi:hypothetical protein
MHEINIQYLIIVQLYLNLLKSGRVSGRLISSHLKFWGVWVQVRSDFESSIFGLSRVSGHSSSG